jgi:hypothetical protein
MLSKIEKKSWGPYFDTMSKALEGQRAEIEVDSLTLGSQIEAEWVPLLGITYDPKSDIVELVMEGLDHMIHHPKEVYAEQDASGLTSIEVIDDDDVHQIVRLHDPLSMPGSDTIH